MKRNGKETENVKRARISGKTAMKINANNSHFITLATATMIVITTLYKAV